MTASAEAIALYDHVRNALLLEIESGRFEEDPRLPSEAELCERFGVSRITVRRALSDLESMGKVRRRQGRGTFAIPQRPVIGTMALGGFTDILTGGELSRRILTAEVVIADKAMARRLGVDPGSQVFHLVRLFMIDGIAHSIDDCLYSLERFPGLDTMIQPNVSTYQVLRERFGVEFDNFERTIGIGFTDEESAAWLDRPEHDPVITIEKVAVDTKGSVVHLSHVQVVPSRLTLKVFSKAAGPGDPTFRHLPTGEVPPR